MTIEDLLAAHELAYGCPDYWRCGCGFVSDRTDGRASINEHRADAIRAHLLGDQAVLAAARAIHANTIGDPVKGEPFVKVERETADMIADARAALTAATEDHQ